MKPLKTAICGVAAAALSATLLSACAGDYGGGYAAAGPMDVYYDGFYGDYPGGYWDGDTFLFRDGASFRRDDGRHFRHDRFASARGFHSMRAPSAAQAGANAGATAPAPRPNPMPPAPASATPH